MSTAVSWIRRDLHLADNQALASALERSDLMPGLRGAGRFHRLCHRAVQKAHQASREGEGATLDDIYRVTRAVIDQEDA